tara:strand:+ start:1137 stop:1547 length:411 start_codon:yes stop_codon:yes gene_type:complete
MKKLILLLSVFAVVLTSCNSDDDNNNGSSEDLFIGSWKFSQSFEDGVEQELIPCSDIGIIMIASDGTFTSTGYDDFGNGCELDFSQSGIWENSGSGMYSISVDNETEVIQAEFSDNTMILFQNSDGIVYRDIYIRQ